MGILSIYNSFSMFFDFIYYMIIVNKIFEGVSAARNKIKWQNNYKPALLRKIALNGAKVEIQKSGQKVSCQI